jgi:hypothetical protein
MIEASADVNITNLITLNSAIQQGLAEGLTQVGKHIVDLASQLAPEDEGLLKASGRYAVNGETLEVSFGNDLPDDRAAAQEYGTIYMPAQPYLGPAVKEIDIVEEIAIAVRRRLT